MTPTDMPGDIDMEYAPTSPGSSTGNGDVAMHVETARQRLRQSMRKAAEARSRSASRSMRDVDIVPVLQFCGATLSAAQEIRAANDNILNLVRELGGDDRMYFDEGREEIMNLVGEVYSQPRLTKAARLLPGLGLLPGFALDLSLTNKDGEQ